ncbi:hypothetical protein F511_22935 [Dorcoceras hygrometricum]|uniref:Uncharacterized protein n=1 Tax=Dorcoceras hygrometricum TaxID=472368 RepID=A0A2Z7BK36_9LAMI|nr:hypothetical protein F511_22935 [Dorcoceras hygrometricum]
MLNRPVLSGRIGKWSLALSEFTLIYFPQKSMKGQAVADFLADHPSQEESEEDIVEISTIEVNDQQWTGNPKRYGGKICHDIRRFTASSKTDVRGVQVFELITSSLLRCCFPIDR